MTDRIGVIDLGRARLKATVWDGEVGTKPLWRASLETGDVTTTDPRSISKAVDEALNGLRKRCDVVIGLGASLFRDNLSIRAEVEPLLSKLFDAWVVLTPDEEGGLLYRSAGGEPNDVLLDVGGGSIQLVWNLGNSTHVESWRLGTFEIETLYGLRHGSSAGEYEAVWRVVHETILEADTPQSQKLRVGSNIMADFFSAVGDWVGVLDSSCWTFDDLERGWRFCASLGANRFESVFSQNPQFMRGGEKALLIASAVAKALDCTVEPTNASVSHGMAMAAAQWLSEHGSLAGFLRGA